MEKFFKTSVAIAGAILTYLFGGWSALMGILLTFVAIDYITGFVAAGFNGELSSNIGLRGIAKKIFIFVIVAIGHLADKAIGLKDVIMYAAIYFYVANEALSIIENVGRIGLPVPEAIKKGIAILQKKSESKEADTNG